MKTPLILTLTYDVIGMVRKSEKIHFRYNGRMQSALDIFQSAKKRRGRSKYLLSVEAEAVKEKQSIPVKLVFVRNRNNQQDYLILVSTDINLTEEEIIQTYGKRWNIEVFFKMCKSYLKLGKESRTMSYDAMTAHVSVVLARCMLLSLEQRRKVDKRSIGELFYISCDELQDLQYMDALTMVLKKLVSMITEKWLFLENELNAMLDSFLENLPNLWHNCLKRCV